MDLNTALGLYAQRSPGEYQPNLTTNPASDVARHGEQPDQTAKLANKYTNDLNAINSDDRLDYVKAANPAITEENLGQLALLTHRDWLDDPARDRMRKIARELAQDQQHPAKVLERWLSEGDFDRLIQSLDNSAFPDPNPAVCYALCEASELAHATYRIQEARLSPGGPMPRIIQTPEEIAADRRAARLT